MAYTTKATWLGPKYGYGCRIFFGARLIVEGRCKSRYLIGATFRDLFRTLDKLGGDAFTSAARKRRDKEGNPVVCAKHYWNGRSRSDA
jgi:hypothetical protein